LTASLFTPCGGKGSDHAIFLPAAFKEQENGLFAACLPLLCFVIFGIMGIMGA
jgi:hypothetical protein